MHPKKAPELQLRIVLEKETYAINEKLFTRVEFTNLTDKTLCFPEPEQRSEDPVIGYLVIEGTGPKESNSGRFIEHFDGSMPDDQVLLAEMEKAWIKLAPNGVYVAKRAEAHFALDANGEWQLRATYYPPESPFAPDGSRERLRTLGKMIGCTPPEVHVTAPIVKLHVAPPSGH